VAHAYTPGLRVAEAAVVRRERRLPLRGEVLVRAGEQVRPETIVARTELPGHVQAVNLAARLSLDPPHVPGSLAHPVGATVRRGEVIAEGRSLFGLVRTRVEAPADGVIESVSPVTGQLLLREPPFPVEIGAFLGGTVAEVLPGEGVVVEARGAFLQGIFGVGGEAWGPVAVGVDGPGDVLPPGALGERHRGAVVVGGAYLPFETIGRARELGVAAIVAGGFDDRDLRRLLGRDLGVAITGQEDVGITLVLTEGFGHIPMADRAWRLLAGRAGAHASVSGATQIRAGVLRPEVIIPGDTAPGDGATGGPAGGLEVGAPVRLIRAPLFGRIGEVEALPSQLHALETEAMVRALVVRLEDGTRVTVPRANVERIAR
jgi:hypothetical protein